MPLSWNEIKSRALQFSKEWETETNEKAEAKSFWDGFFNVFGVSRRRLASFEQFVKKLNNKDGYIDLYWPGTLIVEHKSKGKNLDKAYNQAMEYFPGISEKQLPKYILVSDFERFKLHDIETGIANEFVLKDFVKNVHLFGFIAGYEKKTYKEQDQVNIDAAYLMGELHDMLKKVGYEGHQLELYLVRLLFCLFSDDTDIFQKGIFNEYIELKTAEDGSDLAAHIANIFQVLNTPQEKRLKNLDESLTAFPYVNGKLFEENLPIASFDSKMRKKLLECCSLDWARISPAIFGSMFQSVMDENERRNLGAHYTSEKNILKVINPLFLDRLRAEFESIKINRNKLEKFHDKISKLRFLDPACGCGNFLVIAYRELRLLEIDVIKALNKTGQYFTDIKLLLRVEVDHFYGIEYEEFPAQIAQVAMWLTDHQMNMRVSVEFGDYYVRLPLTKSPAIIHGNALHIDWQSLLNRENTVTIFADKANVALVKEPEPVYKTVNVFAKEINFIDSKEVKNQTIIKFDYIMGNPPFIGKHLQSLQQKEDMQRVFAKVNGSGVLDYVCAWYLNAAKYLAEYSTDKTTSCAFVSTNSIAQGEQVGILWNELFNKYGIKIHFAHQTFKWGNEGRNNAAVHVVIIGFSNYDISEKHIYEYEDIREEPHVISVKNVNPYLVEGNDIAVNARRKPLCNVPEMLYGNKIVDGGYYLFTSEEKKTFLKKEPRAGKFFRKILSGDEFINGSERWVLFLKDISPAELKSLPEVLARVEAVKEYRQQSTKNQTRFAAETPTLFAEPRQPVSDFLLVPRTTSENRKYIPLGFFSPDYIVNDSCMCAFVKSGGIIAESYSWANEEGISLLKYFSLILRIC